MRAKIGSVNSRWSRELGHWNGRNFANVRVVDMPSKLLEVELWGRDSGAVVLAFVGGPTGYEQYTLDEYLLESLRRSDCQEFVICAGTINSWSRCSVLRSEVLDLVDSKRAEAARAYFRGELTLEEVEEIDLHTP